MAKKESPEARAARLEAALVEVYGIADEADGSRQSMTSALDEITEAIEAAVPDVADQWSEQSIAAPEDEDADLESSEDED
jgi:hypothetical protein